LNYDRIKKAIPTQPHGSGRRNLILHRPDIVEILLDIVLRRRTYVDIAKRIGCNYATLERFRKRFVTDELKKVILHEAKLAEEQKAVEEVVEAQDDIQTGIVGIISEQKKLYARLNEMAAGSDEDFAGALAPMMQLLRDQTKSHEALLKVYNSMKEHTVVDIPLAEHPEAHKLLDCLFLLFREFPDAFARFEELAKMRQLTLDGK